MKKIITMLLALTFTICVLDVPIVNALTQETQITTDTAIELSEIEKNQVETDLTLFKEMGLDINCISPISVQMDSSILYKITYDETSELAQIKKNDEGDITLTVENGNLHDTITIEHSGKLFLDNKEVSFDNFNEKNTTYSSDDEIDVASQYGHGSIYKTSPIKGKSSEYTTKVKTIKNPSVKTNKVIKKMTISAIATIIKNSLQLCMPETLPVTVISTAAKHVKSAAEANAPTSEYLSYSLTKYAYKNNTKLDKYYKYTGNYYPKKNYAGKKCPHTFYEYNAIGL